MDPEFWHQRWKSNRINFHERDGNALLIAHFNALSVPAGGRVFLPLCGKTRDIAWLLSKGHRVGGAELSELAVQQLFAEIGIEPQITDLGALKNYSAPDLDIFVGDIFAVTRDMLGPVDAVFDRAALVALPEAMRVRYARHIAEISRNARQLLITFEYDQAQMAGPPFSVRSDEVRDLYNEHYEISPLASVDVPGGLKGVCPAREHAWLLQSPD